MAWIRPWPLRRAAPVPPTSESEGLSAKPTRLPDGLAQWGATWVSHWVSHVGNGTGIKFFMACPPAELHRNISETSKYGSHIVPFPSKISLNSAQAFRLIGDGLPRVILSHIALASAMCCSIFVKDSIHKSPKSCCKRYRFGIDCRPKPKIAFSMGEIICTASWIWAKHKVHKTERTYLRKDSARSCTEVGIQGTWRFVRQQMQDVQFLVRWCDSATRKKRRL